jgi:predicted nucleic acid-binding protein
MNIFADTNFFTHLWLGLAFQKEAEELLATLARAKKPLPVTGLLHMELTNAFQRLVFESRSGTQIVRVSPEAALMAAAMFDEELSLGVVLRRQRLPEDDLKDAFDALAYRYTAKHGFRTYDIVHVASALLSGCDTFWTFDERAKKLARLEGLSTN